MYNVVYILVHVFFLALNGFWLFEECVGKPSIWDFVKIIEFAIYTVYHRVSRLYK